MKASDIFVSALLIAFLVILPMLGEPGLADPKTAGFFGLWVNFLGTLHPLFLHLPIGAFLLVLCLEGVGLLSRGRYQPNTTLPLLFTLVSSFLSLIVGYCLYLTGSYSGDLIELHKTEAFIFCGLILLCLLLKLALCRSDSKSRILPAAYALSLLACGGAMAIAGHHGGQITHGDPLEKLPTRVLAQRAEAAEVLRGDPVVYQHVIRPILEERCVYCHGADKQEGSYRMDSFLALLAAGDSATGLVPGDLERSAIVSRLHLLDQDEHHMPPSDKPQPTVEEIALLEWWVSQGAPQSKKRSEMELTPEVEEALGSLISPADRIAREQERKRKVLEERRLILAAKKQIEPELQAFNQTFPGALAFISNKSADMRFNGISFLSTFGGAELAQLKPFAHYLSEANFSQSGLDDAAAATLGQFTSLRKLNLSQTDITDGFLANIAGLTQLELLNLYGTKITPASAGYLEQMPALKTLYIGETGFSDEQTVALRDRLSENRGAPVTIIGVDAKPDLKMLSPEGIFVGKMNSQADHYGQLIGGRAELTLSSFDHRYSPAGSLVDFTSEKTHDRDYVFHSGNEVRPWVQVSFDNTYRISAFILKNRATLPQRAEGLVLQRLLPDGRWETVWQAEQAEPIWRVDLSEIAEGKREAAAFRLIIDQAEPAMLHLAHLSLWGQPLAASQPAPADAGKSLDRTGSGALTYIVAPDWGKVPGQEHIGSTHGGVVVDRAGRVYVSTDGPNGIIVYRSDGTYLTSFAKGADRYHGLCINREDGEEFIYAADNGHVAKYRLSGQLVMKIEGAKQAAGNQWHKATAVAVAPNGDLFIADGYGSSVIFKYNAQGQFLKKFGIRGSQDGQFITSHGLAVDNRNPDKPLLVVCDRENRRLQHFDMEGQFVKVAVEGLRRPCAVSIWKDYMVVAELAGRVVILDRDYKIVSVLGDNPVAQQHAKFGVHPHDWKAGVFTAPHGCSFDHQGNLYIQDWNKWGRISKLLLRSRLTPTDIARLEALQVQLAASTSAGSESGWKPSELTKLGLWLDADDPATITATAGRVSQWNDKSGKQYHAYALSPAERPTVGAVKINGIRPLEFHHSRLISKTPEHGNWQDLYIVADWNGGARFDNYNGLFTGFQGGIGVIGNSRGVGTGLWVAEKWWSSLLVNAAPNDGSDVMATFSKPFLVSCSADKPVDVTGFGIGNDRSFVGTPDQWRDWEGSVCEIVAFERKLSDPERQQVEGYLAHKWGLTAALPASHPYKQQAP